MDNIITLSEFKKSVKRVYSPRTYKVTNSYGIRDAFLYLQKNKWFNIGRALPEHAFQKIVREVNNILANDLMNGNSIAFPEHMGILEIRKTPRFVRMEDGKIKTNYRIDWDKTLELWYNDKEARESKTLVRDIENTDRFRILYNRATATYNNKCYTEFLPQRAIRRILAQNVKQGNIDAHTYGRVH